MEWNRSNALGLAKGTCFLCKGMGLRAIYAGGREVPCNCVFRAIFRACFNRFQLCMASAEQITPAALEFHNGKDGRRAWGRRREEFAADFQLVSRRSLSPSEYQLFKFHFLLGADWKMCCRRLKMDRGSFFHETYRVEQRLGRIFATLQPYPLYPIDEYFGGVISKPRDLMWVGEPPTSADIEEIEKLAA